MADPAPENHEVERRLTLGEHLEELRARVIRALLGFSVAIVVCLCFQDALMAVATWPHYRTMKALGLPTELNAFTYPESFTSYMSVILIAALFLSAPWMLYQLWLFIRAGLYRTEQTYVTKYIPATLGLFFTGILFGYFFLIPIGLRFLVSYGSDLVKPSIRLEEYLSFFFLLTASVGCVFELPLFMVFFAQIGVVTADQYAAFRRHAVLAAFVVGAIFTPPDPFSQTLLAVPLYLLYEVGIWICRRLERARAARAAVAPPPPNP